MLNNISQCAEAILILKSDGQFRGGDPELLQQKKEEQDEEEASLDKAAGEEGGQFRGGDPELLQQKKEEARQARADAREVARGRQQDAGGCVSGDGFVTLAEIDEWQTEMQLKPMRKGRIQLYTTGLDPALRAITGVEIRRARSTVSSRFSPPSIPSRLMSV